MATSALRVARGSLSCPARPRVGEAGEAMLGCRARVAWPFWALAVPPGASLQPGDFFSSFVALFALI